MFAYSTILHPHTPYYPPKRYLDRFFHGRPVPAQALDIQANFHAYANGDFGEAREGIEALKLCYQAVVHEYNYPLRKLAQLESEYLPATD